VKFLWGDGSGTVREIQVPIQKRNVVSMRKRDVHSRLRQLRSDWRDISIDRRAAPFVSTCLKTRLELIKIHRNQSPADFSDTSTRGSIRKRRRGVCGYGGCIVSLEIKARRFDNLRYRAKRMGAAGGGRQGGWRARFAEEIKYYFPIKRYYLPLDGTRRIT